MAKLSAYISRFRAGAVIIFMVAVTMAGFASAGHADKSHLVSVNAAKHTPYRLIELTKGMAQVIPVSGPVADIMVANPSVVDVTALQSDKLYVVGLSYGTTNVMAVDATGNVLSDLDIHVKIDDVAIQSTVNKLFPHEDVKIAATGDQIILTGHVSNPDVAQRVANLVGNYVTGAKGGAAGGNPNDAIINMLTVAGEQQVLLKVKVVEVSRSLLRELGVETNAGAGAIGSSSLNPSGSSALTNLSTAVGSGLAKDPLSVGAVLFNQGSHGVIGPIEVIIRALEESDLVNTLAEPNLTAISGEQAGFLAGGEFPIPTSRDQNNNVVVTYKPFGVALNFKPVVLSEDRISLQLQTEVSSVSTDHTLTSNGIVIPGFNVRRASTTVELGSGGSLMIAGLLQANVADNLRQLPGIKDVPILGALLSSRSFERDESEMVVIVTAYLVNPYDDHSALAQKTPESAANPLARVFADNIHQTYAGVSLAPDLLKGYSGYGYLIK